jgi:hypothetical protein
MSQAYQQPATGILQTSQLRHLRGSAPPGTGAAAQRITGDQKGSPLV